MKEGSLLRHKDFKWLSAIAVLVLLALTWIVFNLFYLTSKPVAVELGTVVVASLFSPNGLDEEAGLETARRQLESGGTIQPIPGLPIKISAQDIAGLSAREIRLLIFRQIVEPIYEGEEAIEKLTGRDFTRQELMSEYGVILLLSRDTHRFIARIFYVLLFMVALALVPLIRFSHGWGRLVSPALALGVSVLPWLILFTAVWFLASQSPPVEPQGQSIGQVAGHIAQIVLPPLTGGLARIYLTLFLMSVILLLAAAIGKRRSKHSVASV